jgi:hypothetical protein
MKLPYFKFGTSSACTYCGDTPDGLDHVICIASQTINKKARNITGFGPVTYCCSSCNSIILNGRRFGSFMERCEYVSRRLNKKADPVNWSKEQLMELDHGLRTYIERDIQRRLWYRFRSDWFQSRDFFLGLESLQWQKSLDPSGPYFSAEIYEYFKSSIHALGNYWSKE